MISPQSPKLDYKGLYKTNPELTKVIIKKLLESGLVRVHFTKVNGEFRDMECTTKPELISLLSPEKIISEENKQNPKIVRKENDNVCRVFDVNKKDWRSFKWENMIEIIQDDNHIYY